VEVAAGHNYYWRKKAQIRSPDRHLDAPDIDFTPLREW